MCGQWRYDAYGAATVAEHLYAFPAVRCGHQALFFDRLDSASADSLGNGGGEPPRLTMLLTGGEAETLNTTEEHPFYVEGRGWVEAQNLRSGDLVRSLVGGSAAGSSAGNPTPVHEVESVEFTSRRATVHNFEVEGVHTYRVGAGGVLVHNQGPCKFASGAFDWSREARECAYEHVQNHGRNDLGKGLQGVFVDDPVIMTEAAWAKAQQLLLRRSPSGRHDVVLVAMGAPVGWQGGRLGRGQQLSTIRIVLERDSNRVVSAYPVAP